VADSGTPYSYTEVVKPGNRYMQGMLLHLLQGTNFVREADLELQLSLLRTMVVIATGEVLGIYLVASC